MNDHPRLLLVEDEPNLREALEEYMMVCGFEVLCATTAREALTKLPTYQPRLLLSDIHLPDVRGSQFLADFHAAAPHCLIFVHSGDALFRASESAELDFVTEDRIFYKPADLGQIVLAMRQALSQTRD